VGTGGVGVDLQRRGRALLNLSAEHIAELCAEIRPLVIGARISAVRGLPPADVVLIVEHEGAEQSTRLCISADPDAPRIHIQRARVARHEGPLGPFFRRLSEELTGGVIVEIAPVRGDRIVIIEVRESPVGARRALLAELVGRHSNLVLLGPEDRVLDVLVPPRADVREARLAPGKFWAAPPGLSSAKKPGDAVLCIADAFPTGGEATGSSTEASSTPSNAPASWIVECALGGQADLARRTRSRSKLVDRVERKLSRARALVNGLERRLEASAQHDRLRSDGELLKANMHLLRRGMAEIEVADHFVEDAPMRRIELDPKRSPQDNLSHLFDRAKKLERALGAVESELELARHRVQDLEALHAAAKADGCDAEQLDANAVVRGLLDPPQEADERKRKEPQARLPYRSFRALHGSEVRVGRSARDNDDLTFHHARGNDVWLHTSDAPGSHVVLCLAGATEADPEELLDAAHLAVQFSPLRGSSRASVHVARRKEVHKPRGAKAGLVTLSGGRILHLRLQPERIARLLGDHRREESGPHEP
jgi:predicted ribosome quality control (RQC) complex YloA/Tae2 family protein